MTHKKLPVMDARDRIVDSVESKQVTIIVGPTGSGKTTQVPQFILDMGLARTGMIACTEPKRIAAMSVANRVAAERGVPLGAEVGYVIRFEWKLSEATKLLFATCGILLQTAISDPMLSKFSCVIVDEAHQRDLFSDFLLGYLKRVCVRRPEFRLVIMSATLQSWKFLEYFPGARLVTIPDRQHPITITYAPPPTPDYVQAAAERVREIHTSTSSGDVLVFMPGEREIRQLYERIGQMSLYGLKALPLFGGLDPKRQYLVFQKIPERKVVIATNVAESSITIDNVSYVIDSGFAKEEGFDPRTGVRTLELQRVSLDAVHQRTGRTGRVGPGTCIRLYSEEDYRSRQEHTVPIIARSDISELVLAMRSLGTGREFDFLTPPTGDQWDCAEQMLRDIGALDEQGTITERGRQLTRLALDLRLAHFVMTSVKYGCVVEAVTIAAMLTVGRFFIRELYEDREFHLIKAQLEHPESDFLTLLNIWDAYDTAIDQEQWCRQNRVNPFWMNGVTAIRTQTLKRLEDLGIQTRSGRNRELLDLAITDGFKHNVLRFRQGERYADLHRNPVFLSRDSVLAERNPQYAVCYELTGSSRIYANCLHQLKYEVLAEVAPEALELHDNIVVPERAVRLKGKLDFEIGGHTRRIRIDVDLTRSTSREARAISPRQVLIEESAFPIRLLPLSDEARAELAEAKIATLSQLPNSGEELAAQGISYPIVREVLNALEPIGFLRRSFPLPERPVLKRPDLTEDGIEPTGDRLAQGFLEQPIEALKLSGKALMILWSAGIKLVGDLTERNEKALLKELREYVKRSSRGSSVRGTDVADVVQEVKARLMHFGLQLNAEKDRSRGFNRDLDTMRLPVSPIDEEKAIDMLGGWYPYYKAVREGDDEDRVFCRNIIAEANLGLPGRFCRNLYWYWKMVDDPMLEFADLFQEGCIGLLWAIEKYDYTRGFKISTYAVPWITQHIFRALDNSTILPAHVIDKLRWWGRQHSKLTKLLGVEPTREEFAEHLGKSEREVEMFYGNLMYWRHFASADEPRKGEDGEEGNSILDYVSAPDALVEDRIDASKLRSVLEKLLNDSQLQAVDKEILTLRHGLFGHRSHTLEEVGEYLGVTRERVRQREGIALQKFRTKEVWDSVKDFLPGMQPDKEIEHEFYIDDSGIITKRPVSTLKVVSETRPTMEEILDGVARQYRVTRDELLDTKRRDDLVVIPQRVAMHLLTADAKLSYAEVGVMFAIKIDQLHKLLQTTKPLRVEAQQVLDAIYRARLGLRDVELSPDNGAEPGRVTGDPAGVIDVVARYYGVSRNDLLGDKRTGELVVPRHAAMFLLRTDLELTFEEIGDLFNRDYSTVISVCQKVGRELSKVPESKGTMNLLRKRLQQEGGQA